MPHSKKALILDLDNTIFRTSSIGDEVYAPLMELIRSAGYTEDLEEMKAMLNRKPFQHVAKHFGLDKEVTDKGIALLTHTTYNKPIDAFPDYAFLKTLPYIKYLVTMGFTALQHSKVAGLGIAGDFAQVYVVDQETSEDTKKTVFQSIMDTYGYDVADVLAIGDDPDSEINAAQELGMDALLYDKDNLHPNSQVPKISSFQELKGIL